MILYIAKIIRFAFSLYTLLLMVRIFGSWIPRLTYHPAMRFVRFYTEPYLGIFRNIVPPIGGVLDLSPMLGFFALSFIERAVMRLLNVFV